MKLSHAETQALISARLDGPLDPVAERELNAHLATCDSCRAFNASAGQLARGLQSLPYLPASPAVTRAVLDHVSTPRSPLSWLAGSFPANALPAASAIAAAVIVVFVGSFAAFRFLEADDEPSTIPASTRSVNDLAQGVNETAEATLESAETVESVSAPTETVEGQTATTEEPAPTTDSSTATDPAEESGEPATGAAATDEPTEELSSQEATEIGPPPGPAEQLQPPTGETAPEPTEEPTTEPATQPSPTSEPTQEPTGEPEPTEAATEIPVVEPPPTSTPEPTTEPTAQPTLEPTAEPTVEPTAVPTDEPTPVPTSEPTSEPTAEPTQEPTLVPTEAPTAEPTPEPTPTIVPIISREDEASESGEADEAAGDDETEVGTGDSDPGSDASNQTVGPSGIDQSIIDPDGAESAEGDDATPDSDQTIQSIESEGDSGDGDGDGQVIEPPGGEEPGTEPGIENSPDDETVEGADEETTQSATDDSLAGAEIYASVENIPGGDPTLRLGLSADGQLIFSSDPGRVSLEQNGILLGTSDGPTGQVVVACDTNGSCVDISSASATTDGLTDTPIGWLNGEAIYERLNGDAYGVEFRAITFDPASLQPVDDRPIFGGDADLTTLIRPYPVDGALMVPAPAGWLRISPSSVEIVDGNPYGGDLGLIRLNPSSGQISYVSGGTLIIASIGSPGSPSVQLPFAASDYAVSPDGSRVAVVNGAGIEIWDTSGNVLTTYANDGIQLGSLTWLPDGLVFVDLSNGVLRILQP